MPELERPSQTGQTPSDQDDAISHLHKMSTTAGVGSQDYVAINNAAIVSVILGMCTALAFLGIPFLIVGAAGIVSGIIALVQIRHSNGTQGGRGLAILGMLLSLALAGSVAAVNIIDWKKEQQDQAEIDQMLEQLGQVVASEQYDKAYQFFTPEFHGVLKLEVFRIQLQQYQQYFGRIEGMSSNGRFQFFAAADGTPVAQTQTMFRFKKPTAASQPAVSLEPRRVPTSLHKMDGQWRINAMDAFHKP
jgi:hypothetical protein